MSGEPRYTFPDPNLIRLYGVERCLDCGSLVCTEDKPAHTRFHSILSSHAWTLAVLKTSHIAAHVHDKYDAVERIDSRKFDNWSADALAEVVGNLRSEPPGPHDEHGLGGEADEGRQQRGQHEGTHLGQQ